MIGQAAPGLVGSAMRIATYEAAIGHGYSVSVTVSGNAVAHGSWGDETPQYQTAWTRVLRLSIN